MAENVTNYKNNTELLSLQKDGIDNNIDFLLQKKNAKQDEKKEPETINGHQSIQKSARQTNREMIKNFLKQKEASRKKENKFGNIFHSKTIQKYDFDDALPKEYKWKNIKNSKTYNDLLYEYKNLFNDTLFLEKDKYHGLMIILNRFDSIYPNPVYHEHANFRNILRNF